MVDLTSPSMRTEVISSQHSCHQAGSGCARGYQCANNNREGHCMYSATVICSKWMRLLSLHVEGPASILLRLGRRNDFAVFIFTSIRIEGLCVYDLGEHMLVSWTLGSSGMLHSGPAFVSEVCWSRQICLLYHALARQNCCEFF